jgi:hypothetical protein
MTNPRRHHPTTPPATQQRSIRRRRLEVAQQVAMIEVEFGKAPHGRHQGIEISRWPVAEAGEIGNGAAP